MSPLIESTYKWALLLLTHVSFSTWKTSSITIHNNISRLLLRCANTLLISDRCQQVRNIYTKTDCSYFPSAEIDYQCSLIKAPFWCRHQYFDFCWRRLSGYKQNIFIKNHYQNIGFLNYVRKVMKPTVIMNEGFVETFWIFKLYHLLMPAASAHHVKKQCHHDDKAENCVLSFYSYHNFC